MQQHTHAFLEYLDRERGYTQDTVRTYRSALSVFSDYLQQNSLRLADVDRGVVRGWLTHMADRGNSASSRSARLTCLKTFFKWAKAEGVAEDVAADVEGPKTREPEVEYLNRSEAKSLLKTVREQASDFLRERDGAIVATLLGCGLRRSELVGIDLSDADFEDSTITVTRKGRKVQSLPMNESVREALQNYLEVRPESDCEALFLSRGDRMHPATVWALVKKYMAASGLEGSPMTLRHTYATQLMRSGVHLRTIQQLMGHAFVTTTERYTHVGDDQMRAAAEAVAF